ncbi:MAG: Mur ligase family protein, partial [Lentimicrobiaceae bacterium]|nr:Mur ligase family protein [Lentimicrobiaceae bacterium]
ITRFQKEDGNLIYNFDDYQIGDMIRENSLQRNYYGYSLDNVPERGMKIKDNYLIFTNNNLEEKIYNLKDKRKLLGEHNILNIMAAAIVCNLLNIKNSDISAGINSFSPLPHRLEYIGVFCGIHFYNDSIATIPEATIRAVQTLKTVDTLIVGGFDRGINYQPLVDFIAASEIQNIICTGDAGKRISYLLNEKEKKYLFTESYEEIIQLAMKYTRKNTICLLSPAAASYDKFKNFEERGNVFKELLKNY